MGAVEAAQSSLLDSGREDESGYISVAIPFLLE